MFTLDQILGLVGTLDDSPGEDTPRERFRRFLRDSLGTTGAVRDYIEACVRNKRSQYDQALQDLINHAATLIGFDVEYGRYKGVSNDIGYDGLWRWKGFTIVTEVKTTDAFAIQTAPVVGYVDKLISTGKVSEWDHAMGLYVFGRTDSELKQLANTIIAEKRTHQLRIATVDSVLSLAELVQDGHITPDEAVALLQPAGVFVGDTVFLLARIAAKSADVPGALVSAASTLVIEGEAEVLPTDLPEPGTAKKLTLAEKSTKRLHLITPVSDDEHVSARDAISQLLGAGWYVFGDRTPGRKQLKPDDRICFYQSGSRVVAVAVVATFPEQKPPSVEIPGQSLEKFPWSFKLKDVRLFLDAPIVIDADLRSTLEAFAGRDPSRPWAWFVQGTHQVSEHDFEILTEHQTSD